MSVFITLNGTSKCSLFSHNLEVGNDREFRQRGWWVKQEKGRAGGETKICLHAASFSLFSPHLSSLSFYGCQDGGHNQCTTELLLKEMWNILGMMNNYCKSEEAEKTLFLVIIIIIKALFKTERPISEVQEEDAGLNR